MFFNLFKKQPEPDKGADSDASIPLPPSFFENLPPEVEPEKEFEIEPPPPPPKGTHPGIPSRLRTGLSIKLAPERQPGTPRTWDSRVLRLDHEGIWVAQDKGTETYLAKVGDTMTVVVSDQGQRHVWDCSVLKVEHRPGNNRPNEVLLAPPSQGARGYAESSGQGKRRHLRISTDLPGECREVRDAELGPPLTVHTLNVSLSGLAFRCNKSLDGAKEVEIKLLAWKFPLHIRATVVRSTRQNDGSYLVAIHFPPEISPITRDLISQFILDNQRNK